MSVKATIARWINKGEFPQKDAPHANPSGWLRSTYDRWLLGAAKLTRREGASVRNLTPIRRFPSRREGENHGPKHLFRW